MTYYTIYVTINKINGRFYIGKHKTDNPFDSYLGSGNLLKRAIDKYGKDNFFKLISEYCPDESYMDKREKEIVNEDFLKEWKDVIYNVCEGGFGGNLKDCPHLLSKDNPRYIEWELKFQQSLPQNLPKDDPRYIDWNKKSVNSIPQVLSKSDPRYIQWYNNSIATKPQTLPKDDPRYIEWYKRNYSNSIKLRGKKMIYNPDIKQCKMVSKEHLNTYLSEGWILGTGKSKKDK